MISIRKYLDGREPEHTTPPAHIALSRKLDASSFSSIVEAYGAALIAMGRCSHDACPALGEELATGLNGTAEELTANITPQAIEINSRRVRERLEDWGRRVARHYLEKAGEVKGILMAMARTVESVGQRDQRCAEQISEVTARLKSIASLEDLNEIRASIEKSASELKESIDRMTEEGEVLLGQLKAEVSNYQAKLETAEQSASRDSLTGLRNRLWMESEMERQIAAGTRFCAAILDMDDFKSVNDAHGHLAGDDLLRQFSTELRSACRATDLIGRWGGDEFLLTLTCGLAEANAQIERLAKWICGVYKVEGSSGFNEIRVSASIGLAEHQPGESLKQLLDRADAEMYRQKALARSAAGAARR